MAQRVQPGGGGGGGGASLWQKSQGREPLDQRERDRVKAKELASVLEVGGGGVAITDGASSSSSSNNNNSNIDHSHQPLDLHPNHEALSSFKKSKLPPAWNQGGGGGPVCSASEQRGNNTQNSTRFPEPPQSAGHGAG